MKIVFTGGGTAGHVMVNRTLIPFFNQKYPECKIIYMGSKNGMEKDLLSDFSNIPFYEISTGKLRRYFSIENAKDIFRLGRGFFDSLRILKRERPQLIYSGGGYVVVPVVWAAKMLKIPVLLRETDYSMGLANRLCLPFAKKIFVTFPDTKKEIKYTPSDFPGIMIRPELFNASKSTELILSATRPIFLVMGGSLGSNNINQVIWKHLNILTKDYSILHICGKGNYNFDIPNSKFYQQIEFTNEIGKYLSAADIVVSRCGSNAISECLSLGKRMICIPISSKSSRGEQDQNAEFAIKNGNAVLLKESELNEKTLIESIKTVMAQDKNTTYAVNKHQMINRLMEHTTEIWREALDQFEKDLMMQAQGYNRVNSAELSNFENTMFNEALEDYGF